MAMAFARSTNYSKKVICKVCDDFVEETEVFNYECGCCACLECLMRNLSTNRINGRKNLDCLCCHAVKRNKQQQDKVLMHLRNSSGKNKEYSDIVQKFDRFLEECAESQDKTFCAHPPCNASFKRVGKNRAMKCEVCNKKTCHDCKLPWSIQHKNTPCIEYKTWVMKNKPEWYIPSDLEDVCFTCPNCKKQFEMVRGGCLHFDCPSCGFEFCGFCRAPFHSDDRNPCKICPRGSKGMHAHHPRICPYFLRDKEVAWLWKLVELHGYQMDTLLIQNTPKDGKCNVKYNTDKGATKCKEEVGHRCQGFCTRHFKESVSGAIFKAKTIDPIKLMTVDELKILAIREGVKFEENWNEDKIRSVIAIVCPLIPPPKENLFFRCPNCSKKHSVIRDGTFRFECDSCYCNFCGFCCQIYVVSPIKCDICPENVNKGLHCHHPRICPYYLMDQEVSWFVKLLEKHGRTVNTLVSQNSVEGPKCGFSFKTNRDGKQATIKCSSPVEDGCQGYCAKHLKQVASEAIFKAKNIDPVVLMNVQQLKNVLKRDFIPFDDNSSEEALIQTINTSLPLVKSPKP